MTMVHNNLARIQKRIIDWEKLIATCPSETTLAAKASLNQLRGLVSGVWQSEDYSESSWQKLVDLERRMEQHSEDLRLRVARTAH